jgi:hypothetical protein
MTANTQKIVEQIVGQVTSGRFLLVMAGCVVWIVLVLQKEPGVGAFSFGAISGFSTAYFNRSDRCTHKEKPDESKP